MPAGVVRALRRWKLLHTKRERRIICAKYNTFSMRTKWTGDGHVSWHSRSAKAKIHPPKQILLHFIPFLLDFIGSQPWLVRWGSGHGHACGPPQGSGTNCKREFGQVKEAKKIDYNIPKRKEFKILFTEAIYGIYHKILAFVVANY